MAKTIDFDRLARDWIAAWNAHDLEKILSHYAEEVELLSPFVARLTGRKASVVRGKKALRDYFRRGLATYPRLRFEFIRVDPGAGHCVLEYRSVNRLRAAELMEFDEHGKIRRVMVHYFGQTVGEDLPASLAVRS